MATDFLIRHTALTPLAGYVDWGKLYKTAQLIRQQLRQRPGTLFTLDCSRVHDFCGYALAELVTLRRELQWQGSDLVLANCREPVQRRLAVPVFASLALGDAAPAEPAEVLSFE